MSNLRRHPDTGSVGQRIGERGDLQGSCRMGRIASMDEMRPHADDLDVSLGARFRCRLNEFGPLDLDSSAARQAGVDLQVNPGNAADF